MYDVTRCYVGYANDLKVRRYQYSRWMGIATSSMGQLSFCGYCSKEATTEAIKLGNLINGHI